MLSVPPYSPRGSVVGIPSTLTIALPFLRVTPLPKIAKPPQSALSFGPKSVGLLTSSPSAVKIMGSAAVPSAKILPPRAITNAEGLPISARGVNFTTVPASIFSVDPSSTKTKPSHT